MVKQAMTDDDQRLMRHAFGSWMAKCKVGKFAGPIESIFDTQELGDYVQTVPYNLAT